MARELTEEEIMLDDKDPLDALREIRIEEGVAEEDLPQRTDIPSSEVLDDPEADKAAADEEELENAKGSKPKIEEEEVDDKPGTSAADGDEEDPDEGDPEEKTTPEKATGPVSKKFKANGKDFEFSQEEMLEQFETVFGKAMNYTQKMQKIAPYRKMISALEEEGITSAKLNMAIDALKGDRGALKKLMEQSKFDAYELSQEDEDSTPYVAKDYGKNETQLEIEEITSMIGSDEEFKITKDVIDVQWDNASRQQIASNPSMIIGLHNDVKSGLYDTVAPTAMKMKVLDGHSKSDIEYYMLAGQQLAQRMETEARQKDGQAKVNELNADAQGADSKFDKASSEANRKRAATSTGARADRKGVIDYLDDDDNDEAYNAWRKNLDAQI